MKLLVLIFVAVVLMSCNNQVKLKNMEVKIFEINSFQENTYILYDETRECVIIDPGCSDTAEEKLISEFISENGLKVVKMLNTHCHIDHVFGARYIKETYNVPYLAHKEEEIILQHADSFAAVYGLKVNTPPQLDQFIEDGDEIAFGNSILKAFHIPGHSPGSLVYYCKEQKFVIVGDVLFSGSIGRTDLPGGNYESLINGIESTLFTLPEDVTVHCGHGPATTIGREKTTNPFFN